jgi:hypothetical protein
MEKCENCGARLAHKEHGELVWDNDVYVFGVWSTGEHVKRVSDRIKREKAGE